MTGSPGHSHDLLLPLLPYLLFVRADCGSRMETLARTRQRSTWAERRWRSDGLSTDVSAQNISLRTCTLSVAIGRSLLCVFSDRILALGVWLGRLRWHRFPIQTQSHLCIANGLHEFRLDGRRRISVKLSPCPQKSFPQFCFARTSRQSSATRFPGRCRLHHGVVSARDYTRAAPRTPSSQRNLEIQPRG